MSRRLRLWWSLRNPREQRLLLVMAALLLATLAWLLLIRPLDNGLAAARARHAAAVLDLATVRERARQVRRIERTMPRTPAAPPEALLRAQALAAGFTAARITPQGHNVSITIEAVRAPAFFGWIAGLERQDGLIVERLSARANSDETLAVDATLRARRR